MKRKKLILIGTILIGIVFTSIILVLTVAKFTAYDKAPNKLLKAIFGKNEYAVAAVDGSVMFYLKDRTKNQIRLGDTVVKDLCVYDIDGDDESELILLTADSEKEYADKMVILKVEITKNQDVKVQEIYNFECGELNPWKVQTADVDGDGVTEISLGVYKTTPFDEVMAKRPYIYTWTSDYGMFPKWRGSSLSRPFEDYAFGDLDSNGKEELISIELSKGGGKILTSYAWESFGFEKTAESDEYDEISDFKCTGKGIIAKVISNNSIFWGEFELKNGTILLKTKSNIYIW